MRGILSALFLVTVAAVFVPRTEWPMVTLKGFNKVSLRIAMLALATIVLLARTIVGMAIGEATVLSKTAIGLAIIIIAAIAVYWNGSIIPLIIGVVLASLLLVLGAIGLLNAALEAAVFVPSAELSPPRPSSQYIIEAPRGAISMIGRTPTQVVSRW